MPQTNFPFGITSMGVPFPGGMLTQGKYIFVKPRTGKDSNSGLSANLAVQTLAKAHSLATAGNNDVVCLFAEGNTAADTTDYQSETLTWSKNNTHLFGITSPVNYGNRARIAQLSTATGISPLMDITASGCIFSNFSIFQGVADATSKRCLRLSGAQRNYFNKVCIQGIGNATMDVATACSLVLDEASENLFEECTIGLDTITRTTSTYEMIFLNGSTRNNFVNCLVPTYSGSASRVFVSAGATSLDRTTMFRGTVFVNAVKSAATQMTEWGDISSTAGGLILLKDCTLIGATDWEANTESANTFIDGAAPTPNTSGLAVLVEAT